MFHTVLDIVAPADNLPSLVVVDSKRDFFFWDCLEMWRKVILTGGVWIPSVRSCPFISMSQANGAMLICCDDSDDVFPQGKSLPACPLRRSGAGFHVRSCLVSAL